MTLNTWHNAIRNNATKRSRLKRHTH